MATPVKTAKKAGARKGVPAKLEDMSAAEQSEVKQAVEQVKGASASIDLNRLADTVDGYAPKPNYIVKSALGMELIWCPPGGYVRGEGDEAHQVILTKGFYLGKFEVTQEEYEKVMSKNPSKFKGDKLPVEMVSWNDAVAFCEVLNKKEKKRGWEFSLPTEAQWEYACRAGTKTIYSWGNLPKVRYANYNHNPVKKNLGIKKTVKVGSYPSNQWGFFEMHGNVREWTLDWLGEYPSLPAINPCGKSMGLKKIMRGGGWNDAGKILSSASRASNNIDFRFSSIGFRVALKQVD